MMFDNLTPRQWVHLNNKLITGWDATNKLVGYLQSPVFNWTPEHSRVTKSHIAMMRELTALRDDMDSAPEF